MKGTGVAARGNALPPDRPEDAAAPEVPFINADVRTNAVLVWDFEENLARHKAIVEALDRPQALVEIRAVIMDVETERSRDLGISWEMADKGGSWNSNAGSNAGEGSGRVVYDSIAGDGFQYATIYKRGLDQFMMRVSALERDGGANILSRPSVLTQDNIQATLEHTETFYVRLEGEREVDLADITTGLTLRVTPHVVDDGAGGIQLAVYIVNGTDAYDDSSRVDNLPRVRQSTISTQAVVYEGEALIVGGYYNELRRDSETGVPVLRKIPGLGALFRARGKVSSKSERLFILSPRIVYPGNSMMADGTEAFRAVRHSPAAETLERPAAEPEPREKAGERRERLWETGKP